MPASVSPVSGNLGNKETTAVTPYVVSPQSGTTVTQIVERINGVITNTITNPASLSRTLTAPQATWDTLAYFGTHTASVTVTDSGGGQAVMTYTFVKRLATSASLLEATKANTDAKNRISQKRDALATQVGLPAGSTFDAISAQLSSGAWSKVATGTASNAGPGSFSYLNNNSFATNLNTVSANLTFKARLIFIFDAYAMTIYLDDPRQSYPKTVRTHLTTIGNNVTEARGFKGDVNDARVDETGFRLPVIQTSTQQYSYIAFG